MIRNRIIRIAAAVLCGAVLASQPSVPAFAKANAEEQKKLDAAAEKKKKLEEEKTTQRCV